MSQALYPHQNTAKRRVRIIVVKIILDLLVYWAYIYRIKVLLIMIMTYPYILESMLPISIHRISSGCFYETFLGNDLL